MQRQYFAKQYFNKEMVKLIAEERVLLWLSLNYY